MENNCLTEEVDSLTVHGIPKIFSTKSKQMKIAWIIMCTGAAFVLVRGTTAAVKSHLKHEIYLRQDRIPKHELKLPAITICNTNMINLQSDGSNGTYPIDQEYPKNCSMTATKYFKSNVNREFFLDACSWFLNEKTGTVGESGTGVFFPKDFVFLPNLFPCVTLNRGSTLIQDGEKARSGLRLILNFNETKHMTIPFLDVFGEERQGLFVNIHDPTVAMPGFSGISMPPGYHTKIIIRKKIIKRKGSPFPSKCFDPDKANAPNIFPGKYLKTNCVFSCWNQRINKECGGIVGTMRTFMSLEDYPRVMDRSSLHWCPKKVSEETNSQSCNCQLPCEEEVYETKTSRIPWPQDWEVEYIVPLMNKAHFHSNDINTAKKHLLKLSIFYEELTEFHFTEEEKYPLINVVSDFGGQMGLFIGASVLSFVEIFLLLAKCIKRRFDKQKIFAS